MRITYWLFITLLFIVFIPYTNACSMYKITKNGKTIVANNEDFVSHNNEIWFEPSTKEHLGVAYVGLMNRFPQGAMNEAGLVFDAFTTPYLELENVEGKKVMKAIDVTHHVMRNFRTVQEVKAYLEGVNLSYIAGGVLMFVDKSGSYLIVEGDILSIGHEASYVQSNFIPSQNPVLEEIKDIDWYQKGLAHVKQKKPKRSIGYCTSVMEAMQNPTTQYTNIFDLDKGTISLYLYHDFENKVELNLKNELAKGTHSYIIPKLFPKDSEGHIKYLAYNNSSAPTQYFADYWNEKTKDMSPNEIAEFKTKSDLPYRINYRGYEWLYEAKNHKMAIEVFSYGTQEFPQNANLFDSLGEAYFEDKQYDLAIKNYGKSLSLNPQNLAAIDMLTKIKERKNKSNTTNHNTSND